MNLTIACRFSPVFRTADQVWGDVAAMTERIAKADPFFKNWWANPRGPKDPYVSLGDRKAFVAQVQENDRKLDAEFSSVPSTGSSGALITNAGNDKDWMKRGGVGLSYSPNIGSLRFHLDRIEKVYAQPEVVAWNVLSALMGDARINFAQANVQQLVNGELLLYSTDRAVFPHREFLGWMGYVNHPLTADQVPDAARLERRGNGTLILAAELLDLSNLAAIKQVNQVEMSLVDLDLLPVTDPSLG